MKNIKNINKLTSTKYLNLYELTYDVDGKDFNYYFASRRDDKNLSCLGVDKVDAVRVLPYIKKDNQIYVVLIKEFRYPLNTYIYSTPAGLVDAGEDTITSAKREVEEEIGGTVISIEKVQGMAYSSAGLTDETLECFEAEVALSGKQALEEFEDINYELVNLNELLEFIDTHKFGMQSALQLREFYYKKKLQLIKE